MGKLVRYAGNMKAEMYLKNNLLQNFPELEGDYTMMKHMYSTTIMLHCIKLLLYKDEPDHAIRTIDWLSKHCGINIWALYRINSGFGMTRKKSYTAKDKIEDI